VIQNDCGQVWQLCTKIYVATVWVGRSTKSTRGKYWNQNF
jgi:hypothetical protein